MDASPLSPLGITSIRLDGSTLVVIAEGGTDDAPCPSCGVASDRVHARYGRIPLDLPWRGFVVRLAVTVRRFRCDNEACARRTFAETFGAILGRRRRFTAGVQAILGDVAATLGGRAGARLAARHGAPASRDTLLRLLRGGPVDAVATPRVLGVDDLALRRGRRYATLLMDMETHEPVDLLKGREAAVLADWLEEHPGVEVMVRDRGGAYAEGARQGAPDAKQVADRFHLAQNVSDALDEVIKRRRWAAPTDETGTSGDDAPADPATSGSDATSKDVGAGTEATATDAAALERAADDPAPSTSPQSAKQQRQAERRAARVSRWRRVHGQAADRLPRAAAQPDRASSPWRPLLSKAGAVHRLLAAPMAGGLHQWLRTLSWAGR